MTQDELISYCRRRSGDTVATYRTSDADMVLFAVEAEREAFERAKLAKFTATLAITSASDNYTLDPLYFEVTQLRISNTTLKKTTREELDATLPNWQDNDSAKPQVWFQENMQVWLYPSPDAAYTVSIAGFRYPESTMELPEELHMHLSDWILHRCYSGKDADGIDLQLSAQHLQNFERVFGSKPSANLLQTIRHTSLTPAFYRSEF